jgi:hypothetical protein
MISIQNECINFEDCGLYTRMMEETKNENDCKSVIMEYTRINNVTDIFSTPMKDIVYTPDNIQRYLDAYLLLDIQSIDKFVSHIIYDYVFVKCILLEVICHYEIIKIYIQKILDQMKVGFFDVDVPEHIIPCNVPLTDNNLIYINKHFHITHLNAYNNSNISDFSVSKLTHLTHLIPNQRISDYSVCFLTNLTCLVDCCEYKQENITDLSVSKLLNLTHLYTSKQRITDISISKLTKLVTLHMSNCSSPITIDAICSLPNLTTLVAPHNRNINGKIASCTQLVHLNIDGRYLTDHKILLSLINLEHLVISYYMYNDELVLNLKNLKSLILSSINMIPIDVYNIYRNPYNIDRTMVTRFPHLPIKIELRDSFNYAIVSCDHVYCNNEKRGQFLCSVI